MDVNELARTVNVADLQVRALLQAQAAGINRGETGSIVEQSDLRQDLTHFFAAEHDGEFLFTGGTNQVERGERPLQRVFVEELEAAEGMVVPLRDQCLTFLTKRKYCRSSSSLI
jgi:hypothetical protein